MMRRIACSPARVASRGRRESVRDLIRTARTLTPPPLLGPHYKLLLATNVAVGVDTNEWAFLNAAVWPDLVRPAKPGRQCKPRSITECNVYPHTVGLPFGRAAAAGRLSLEKFSVSQPNAQTGLSDSLVTLKNPRASVWRMS